MNYYLQIKNDKIISYSNLPVTDIDIVNMQISKAVYDDYINTPEKYYLENGVLKSKTNEEIEEERVNKLTMTALDFVTFLEQVGVSYSDIQDYLISHTDLDKQLKYCQNVYCGVVKQLLPITVAGITLTTEMVEQAFKIKNGEL